MLSFTELINQKTQWMRQYVLHSCHLEIVEQYGVRNDKVAAQALLEIQGKNDWRGESANVSWKQTSINKFYVANFESRDKAQMASEPENPAVAVGGWIGACRGQSAATATAGAQYLGRQLAA